ncbi:MAG: tRNA(Ile)-lysidine synthetase [Sphingomonas bacterium]|nr:tRNA(Ile)-lysidine synthetase [Sphingomonas bacterium]
MPVADTLAARFRADLLRVATALPSPDRRIGIAVSGGPDSLALLLLAHAACPGAVAAATVDHGLRPEAAAEARMVGSVCAGLGIPHHLLTGNAGIGPGSVQQRARRLRYALLGDWAAAERLGWLATAHHLDDQAETLLMRAVRGGGTAGLSGVRARMTMAGMPVPVIRPLLGWRRATLGDVVAQAGLVAADDPSNRDPAYDRTAFRALLANAPRLRPEGLARTAANLADAEEALCWAVGQLAEVRLTAEGGAILCDPSGLPRELRRRLVAAAIARVAGISGAVPLRGESLDRFIALLDSGRAATLAGVAARPGSPWRLRLAPPRRA